MTVKKKDIPKPGGQRGPQRLDLPSRLDLNAADELAEALEHLRETPLDLDASQVTHLSALCLQVLVAARLQWQQDGTPLRLLEPSDDFTAGLARLGVPTTFFKAEMAS